MAAVSTTCRFPKTGTASRLGRLAEPKTRYSGELRKGERLTSKARAQAQANDVLIFENCSIISGWSGREAGSAFRDRAQLRGWPEACWRHFRVTQQAIAWKARRMAFIDVSCHRSAREVLAAAPGRGWASSRGRAAGARLERARAHRATRA